LRLDTFRTLCGLPGQVILGKLGSGHRRKVFVQGVASLNESKSSRPLLDSAFTLLFHAGCDFLLGLLDAAFEGLADLLASSYRCLDGRGNRLYGSRILRTAGSVAEFVECNLVSGIDLGGFE